MKRSYAPSRRDDGPVPRPRRLRSVIASEFAFLALGLVLGIATGAALVEVIRARPPASREIRVTVAPNSIHARRATTLSEDAFASVEPGPAAGGPGDPRWNESDPEPTDLAAVGRRADDPTGEPASDPDAAAASRTSVRGAFEISPADAAARLARWTPLQPTLTPRSTPMRQSPASAGGAPRSLVAVPMSMEPDPTTDALRATATTAGVTASASGATRPAEPASAARQIADAAGSSTEAADAGGGSAASGSAAAGTAPSSSGPCAEERRVADERCSVAGRAREGAAGAAEALRVAQRAYDAHIGGAESGAAATDPRSVRTAKEAAQARFRESRAGATTRDHVEAAARAWLSEINQINHDTREAAHRVERDRAAANALVPVLERLAVEADAARISAERAEEACLAAREAVAACDEARTLAAATAAAPPAEARDQDRVAAAMAQDELDSADAMGSRAGEDAVLLRILRGEREAMLGAVAKLAGDDPDARRRWQTWLSSLAEALIARSIEASSFDFPLDHYFWGPFSQATNRDIAAALASIGYRFDGFGGWADDRVPSQRDLSMAVGYAGEDPMRIRRWPNEAEMRELFFEVRVAADEYVAGTAAGLTLGEMVTLLGRRADALSDLWNEWGSARPILLAAS
jgi:hypothetical protein